MTKQVPGQTSLFDLLAQLDGAPPPHFQDPSPWPPPQQRPEAAAAPPEVNEHQDQDDDQLEPDGPDAAALTSMLRRRAKRLRKADADLSETIKAARAVGFGWRRIEKATGIPRTTLSRKHRDS